MKIIKRIDESEWYPVYEFYEKDEYGVGHLVEIEEEIYQKHKKIFDDFCNSQKELKLIHSGVSK